MSKFLLLSVLGISAITLVVSVFSKNEKKIIVAKLLFFLVSLYLWFRVIGDYTTDISLALLDEPYSLYSRKIELIALVVGFTLALLIDFLSKAFIVFDLIVILLASQIIFLYVDLIVNHKLLNIHVEYNALFIISTFIVGMVIYYISKLINPSK